MKPQNTYYASHTCRYARVLKKMPPLPHSTDEWKAFGGDFDPTQSAVAKYLLKHTRIGFNKCFSVIPEALKAGVLIYHKDINRLCGRDYKGPMPSTKEAGPGRLLREQEKAKAKKRKKASRKVGAKTTSKTRHNGKKPPGNREKSLDGKKK